MKNKRTASFGIGNKTNFASHNSAVPGPGSYRIRSIFDTGKGTTFKFGREVQADLIIN